MTPKEQSKVLIVDDRPENLLAIEAVLETLSCKVVRAHSGIEALKMVEENEFATIVMDIQMPGLDGFETTRRIKRLPKAKGIPVIFVTAVYKEDEDIRRAYEAGGIDFFAKP